MTGAARAQGLRRTGQDHPPGCQAFPSCFKAVFREDASLLRRALPPSMGRRCDRLFPNEVSSCVTNAT